MVALGSLPVLMADRSEVQGDIHSEGTNVALFTDTVKITNPETIRELSERLNDVVEDAEDFGYL